MNKNKIIIIIAMVFLFAALLAACSSSNPEDKTIETNWELVTLAGKPALPDVQVILKLDGEGGLSGFAGCNSYTGNYGLSDNQLDINAIRDTTNKCDDSIMEQENAFMAALQLSSSFDLGSDSNTVTIKSNEGEELMTLKKITQ
jgi:heat shock protein HslJ